MVLDSVVSLRCTVFFYDLLTGVVPICQQIAVCPRSRRSLNVWMDGAAGVTPWDYFFILRRLHCWLCIGSALNLRAKDVDEPSSAAECQPHGCFRQLRTFSTALCQHAVALAAPARRSGEHHTPDVGTLAVRPTSHVGEVLAGPASDGASQRAHRFFGGGRAEPIRSRRTPHGQARFLTFHGGTPCGSPCFSSRAMATRSSLGLPRC